MADTSTGVGASNTITLNTLGPLGDEINIPEMLLAIQVERSKILDSQIEGQMKDMKDRNTWLKNANLALGELRKNMPQSADADAVNYGTFIDADGKEQDVHQFCKDNKIAIEDNGSDTLGTQVEFQSAIDSAKSTIDTVNAQSQMDMVRLQGLMDKRNQAFEMMTNTISKAGKSIDSITGNMR